VRDPQSRPRSGQGAAPIHPTEGHARGRRGPAVRADVVAYVEGLPGRDSESAKRHLEDPGVGLREPAAFGGDHHPKERLEPCPAQARALHAVDAIGDDSQEQPPGLELSQDRTAARQAVAAAGESLEIGRTHARGSSNRCAQEREQSAKALPGQLLLADPALSVELPEPFVDPSILGENRRGAGQTQVLEALAQSPSLGTVEIQEGTVEVEEDGAGAKQGSGYFAR